MSLFFKSLTLNSFILKNESKATNNDKIKMQFVRFFLFIIRKRLVLRCKYTKINIQTKENYEKSYIYKNLPNKNLLNRLE